MSLIISYFKRLISKECDAIPKFVIDPNTYSKYRKTYSLYIKQLQHFMAYGSLGSLYLPEV